LYVALSTADHLAVIDIRAGGAHHALDLAMCAFPDALAPLPGGGVVVACRFDPGLRVVTRVAGSAPWGDFRVRIVDAGPEHGHRGIAIDPSGQLVFVASPPRGGVKIVNLRAPQPAQFVPTGLSPQVLRLVPPDPAAGRKGSLLLVANVVGRTVTVHEVRAQAEGDADAGLSAALQTIATEAPVLDLAVVPSDAASADLRGALLLLTHEDRPVSRARLSVEGLDSVIIPLQTAPPGAPVPFADPGPGKRAAINVTERSRDSLVGLDALAVDPLTARVAIVGAGTDNLLFVPAQRAALLAAPAVVVGANPSAVAFLPDGRVVTADRLSDTLSFSTGARSDVQTVVVGTPERPSPAEQGELLFYSRALVPNNVADGPLSVYTCAGCHVDGEIDGRRHPSKRNRFFSMTKTCRGLQGTEPFLSLGKPDTFAAFADNIVSTHAQGALIAPRTYDHYSVRLRVHDGRAWTDVTLSPEQVRAALAAHLARVPSQPSPFVAPGRRRLTATERRGFQTFRENCSGCHRLVRSTDDEHAIGTADLEARLLAGEIALTSAGLHDVGTPVLGEGGNNPPSLRGVWAAAPYFSDGSADTLDEVLRRTNPDSPKIHAAENARHASAFSATTRADLLAFLRAL
jgi:mono/diheme cytochrome c family protein